MELAAYCQLCQKRPRNTGGNGNCPVRSYPNFPLYWAKGEGLDPKGHDCPSFVAGHLRLKRIEVEQGSLF